MLPRLFFLLSLLLVGLLGCGSATEFEPDRLLLIERAIVPDHREQIASVLDKMFGTPDEPQLPAGTEELLDLEGLKLAAGPVESHQEGVTHGLYRRHCAKCHGVTGDGRGPTALYQHPYPRDFRQGVFKYKSTRRGAPPTSDDLHAILERGVPGTAMPSFRLLKEEERRALVQYVQYLSLRGQFEAALIEFVAEELDFDPESGEAFDRVSLQPPGGEAIEELLGDLVRRWREAGTRTVDANVPEGLDAPEMVAAGRELFHDAKRAGCVTCHGQGAVGGVVIKEQDDWTKRRMEFRRVTDSLEASLQTLRRRAAEGPGPPLEQLAQRIASDSEELSRRRSVCEAMLPPAPAEPRTIADGVLHGGREPLSLFRTIHQGLAGTPMPSAASALSNEEIWRLVAYLRSIAHRGAPPAEEAPAP